jgi:hypothetical protein
MNIANIIENRKKMTYFIKKGVSRMEKEEYDNDFYEEAGDLLAGFRKKNGGGFVVKDDKDPFANDPDVLQSGRDDKLRESEGQSNFRRD